MSTYASSAPSSGPTSQTQVCDANANNNGGGGGADPHAKLKELWAALNAMAERNAKQSAAASASPTCPIDTASPHSSSSTNTVDAFAAAEAELSDISLQIRQTIKTLGSSPSASSSSEVGQMEDLMQLLEEMQQMQAAHRSRRVREEQCHQKLQISADGPCEEGAHSSDDDDGDEGYEARRAAKADAAAAREYHEEQLHQATVDAVMAAMADHLPKFSDHILAPVTDSADAGPLDDVTLSMAMELLVDADIRQSFVDLKAQLGTWMAASAGSAADKKSSSHSPADWARYEGQLQVATELSDLFASAECVAVIAQHLQQPQQQSDTMTDEIVVVRRVATQFNSLMNALTAFGDAPNGLYGAQQ